MLLAWVRPGLPRLSNLAGPIQHFRSAIIDAWRNKVAVDLCGRKGFRGGPLLDIHGSLQLLNSSHVRERDKALLRSVMVGGVWNGFLLGRVRNQVLPCRFCGAPDGDGHLFWDCTFPMLTMLPLFGMFVAGVRLIFFTLSVIFRLVEVSVLFLGLFSLFKGLRCGVLFWPCRPLVPFTLGVDNLGVVRHVGRLLDGRPGSIPFELLKDGDLLLLIDRMLRLRGPDTVRISKVKGHADDGHGVLHGQVRRDDKLGNDAADEAAGLGRRRVSLAVIDARRNLSGVCGRWYPVILDLHRFFIAISRAVVNHDGREGTAPNPLVWSAGAPRKRRRLVHAVRDRVFFCLGLLGFGALSGIRFLLLLFLMKILIFGLTPLVFWLSGSLF